MEVYANNIALSFVGNCAVSTKCTYYEFLAMLNTKGFVPTTTEYSAECATPFTPPALNVKTPYMRRWSLKNLNKNQ